MVALRQVIRLVIVFLILIPSLVYAIVIGGGWNTEKNYSSQIEFLRRAENIVFNLQGGIKKRPPLIHYSAVVTHSPIYGMFDFWASGIVDAPSERLLVRIGNDFTYNTDGGDYVYIHTPSITSANIPMDFAVMGDKCVIGFAGNVQPLQYSQTTGKMPELYGCGNSWMFETYRNHMIASGDPAYPSRIYYSTPLVHRDSIDFASSSAGYIDVEPDDGDQVTGIKSFLDSLYVFKGPNKLSIHKITGTSKADFVMVPVVRKIGGYNNTIVEFGNDLAFIDPNGIHSLSASVDYGGVNETFLSAPIQTYWNGLRHNYLDKASGIHVPELHSLLFTVPLAGYTTNQVVIGYDYLVSNIDGSKGRWFVWPGMSVNTMVHRNKDGRQKVYFGTKDYGVNVLDVDSSTFSDYGTNAYTGLILTPYFYGDGLDVMKQVVDLGLAIKPTIASNITGTLMIDSLADQVFYFEQSGEGAVLGIFVLGTDRFSNDRIKIVYPTTGIPEGMGRSLCLQLESATLGANMEIYQVIFYVTNKGVKHD